MIQRERERERKKGWDVAGEREGEISIVGERKKFRGESKSGLNCTRRRKRKNETVVFSVPN